MTKTYRQTEPFSSTRGVVFALAGWFLAGSLSVSAAPMNGSEAFAAVSPAATTPRAAEPAPTTTTAVPTFALQEVDPSTMPTSGSVRTRIVEEILSSSVVSTNFFPSVSPEAIPEPSTLGLALFLFGSAACWSRWRPLG